jgi:hypothetical protein
MTFYLRKTMYSKCSFKKYRNYKKNVEKKLFLVAILKVSDEIASGAGSESVSQMYRCADPDPYQNVTDPQQLRNRPF